MDIGEDARDKERKTGSPIPPSLKATEGRGGSGMTMNRLFLYGPHMFWARFVKDQGYKMVFLDSFLLRRLVIWKRSSTGYLR